ncbi:MAG: RNA-binding S4 domain-containing protein [Clostridia bacterium]|nr:RNA-binding S4 domain-containing protein [Clostridia bacterium]
MSDIILIKSEYIKLDSALKKAGYVSTGGHAKIVIQNGEVKVNGEVCYMRGKKLKNGDIAEFEKKTLFIKNAY